ncbi:unnamed protein product [Cylindrotheca closterium]|uniref:Uncharacterized protein n=1 Tax=Cylindrotheca closterium TaxID=2856 RepID=A0AAD2CGX2_9STRA|nr:unnamed protein product [Cylindrotheca closterium]
MPPYCFSASPTTMEYESKPDMSHLCSQPQQEQLQPRSVSFDEDEQQPAPVAPKKSVSFSPTSELYLIPHHNEMSEEERRATYMTSQDYNRMDRENVATVRQMQQQSFPANDDLYFRGLENALPQPMKERKQRIKFVVFHVLQEQHQSHTLNDEWIESLRYHFTSKSADFANKMGIWDYEAMREDLVNDAKFMSPIYGPPITTLSR